MSELSVSCHLWAVCAVDATVSIKNKSGEKLAESEEDLLEHRTDGTDAFDTLYIGCEKFPYRDAFNLSMSGVLQKNLKISLRSEIFIVPSQVGQSFEKVFAHTQRYSCGVAGTCFKTPAILSAPFG